MSQSWCPLKSNELRTQVLKSETWSEEIWIHDVWGESQTSNRYLIRAGNMKIKSKHESLINIEITLKALKKTRKDRGRVMLVMATRPSTVPGTQQTLNEYLQINYLDSGDIKKCSNTYTTTLGSHLYVFLYHSVIKPILEPKYLHVHGPRLYAIWDNTCICFHASVSTNLNNNANFQLELIFFYSLEMSLRRETFKCDQCECFSSHKTYKRWAAEKSLFIWRMRIDVIYVGRTVVGKFQRTKQNLCFLGAFLGGRDGQTIKKCIRCYEETRSRQWRKW